MPSVVDLCNRALSRVGDARITALTDDTKRARRKSTIASVIYQVASGRGRGRGSIEGTRRTGAWKTVLLSSGDRDKGHRLT